MVPPAETSSPAGSGAGSPIPALKKSGFWHFCPFAAVGIRDDWSHDFHCEMRTLLQRRLRYAGLILFGGSLAFLIRDFFASALSMEQEWGLDAPHILLTITLAVVTAFLWSRNILSIGVLRLCETIIFGGPAMEFLWSQDRSVSNYSGDDVGHAALFLPVRSHSGCS